MGSEQDYEFSSPSIKESHVWSQVTKGGLTAATKSYSDPTFCDALSVGNKELLGGRQVKNLFLGRGREARSVIKCLPPES